MPAPPGPAGLLAALVPFAVLSARPAGAQTAPTRADRIELRRAAPDSIDPELFAATRTDSAAGALEGLEVAGSAPRHAVLAFGARRVEACFDERGAAPVRVRHGGHEIDGIELVPLGPDGSRGWRAEVDLDDDFSFALIWLRGPAMLLRSARNAWVGTMAVDGATLAVGLLPLGGDGAIHDLEKVHLLVDRNGDGAFAQDEAQASHLPFRRGDVSRRAVAVEMPEGAAAGTRPELVLEPFDGDTAPALGFRFPDAALQGHDGTETTLRQLLGQRVVINVWARHCAPCVRELPALHELANRGAEGVRYLSIAPGPLDGLRAFLETHPFAYEPFVAADDSELFAHGYPWHYVLDADGRVVYARFGASPDRTEEIARALETLRR